MKRLLYAAAIVLVGFFQIAATLPLGPGSIFPLGPSSSIAVSFAGPCDIAATAGTPCVAAHSVTRKLFNAYAGSLFQITRASDSTTQNIAALPNGRVNQATIDTFCAATNCFYSLIYDQTGNGNDLPQATAVNQAPLSYTTFSGGQTLPMVGTAPTQFYRNRVSTSLIPTGNNSITEYDVINTFTYSPCCGTYGDMESTIANNGSGHMFALGFGIGAPRAGTGNGPWPAIDYENGFYTYGATPSATLLLEIAKTPFIIKSDPGLTGTLTTQVNTTAPATAAFEGGLSLGEGGDGTQAPTAFFEGVVIAAATTDATDNAIAANIAAFYGGTPTAPKQTPITFEANQCSAAATSCAFNFIVNIPSGSLIVILTFDQSTNAALDTITDTQNNVYTLVSQQCSGFANGNPSCATSGNYSIFYCFNSKAVTVGDTMTITNATATRLVFNAAYATGMPATDPLDSATIAKTFGASRAQAITSGTPTQSGEFFVAIDSDSQGAGNNPPLGWVTPFVTKFINNWGNGGVIRNPANAPLKWSDGTATGNFAAAIVGFKTQ